MVFIFVFMIGFPVLMAVFYGIQMSNARKKMEEARRAREIEERHRAETRQRKIEEARRARIESAKKEQLQRELERKLQRQKRQNEAASRKEFSAEQRRLMTPSLRYKVLQRDNFRCVLCGASASDGVVLHVDHIYPVSKGGKTELSNLRTLCETCNLGKGDKIEGASVYKKTYKNMNDLIEALQKTKIPFEIVKVGIGYLPLSAIKSTPQVDMFMENVSLESGALCKTIYNDIQIWSVH